MSLTQERINEIALECGLKYLDIIHDGSIQAFANEFLSRIREEQKIRKGYECVHCGMVYVDHKVTACDCLPQGKEQEFYEVIISTIPPAAPECDNGSKQACNCKELVEALEIIRKGDDSPRTIAMVALAKHKASMGEK